MLFRDVQQFVARAETRICTSSLFHAFEDGTASKEVLTGYVLEYFHVVHASPAILGQALAHGGAPQTYRIMRDYFLSECRHDELLLRSLETVGINPIADSIVPLPSTFASISALSMLARQDLLSFKSVLFIFERPQPEFHEAFVRRCIAIGLPDLPPAFVHVRIRQLIAAPSPV